MQRAGTEVHQVLWHFPGELLHRAESQDGPKAASLQWRPCTEDGKAPEKVEQDHASTYLQAKLNCARLRTKMKGSLDRNCGAFVSAKVAFGDEVWPPYCCFLKDFFRCSPGDRGF